MKNPQHTRRAGWCSWAGMAGLLTLCSLTVASAEHTISTTMLKGYHGRDGQPCCGLNDCVEATVALLEQGATDSTVMIGEYVVTLPNAWLHPSPDPGGHGWWCYVPQAQALNQSPTYRDQDGNVRAVPPEKPTRENSRCVFFTSML